MLKRYNVKEISKDHIIITDAGKEMEQKSVADKLNEYEDMRKSKNKQIAMFREREERYQMVIGGIIAYLKLKAYDELIYDD